MSESKCQKCAELEAELERVQKQAAAMKEALTDLNGCRNVMANSLNWFGSACAANNASSVKAAATQFWNADKEFGEILQAALATDAGREYVSKEQVRPLVETLTRINEISVIDEDMGCAVNWAGDALTHARAIGL